MSKLLPFQVLMYTALSVGRIEYTNCISAKKPNHPPPSAFSNPAPANHPSTPDFARIKFFRIFTIHIKKISFKILQSVLLGAIMPDYHFHREFYHSYHSIKQQTNHFKRKKKMTFLPIQFKDLITSFSLIFLNLENLLGLLGKRGVH